MHDENDFVTTITQYYNIGCNCLTFSLQIYAIIYGHLCVDSHIHRLSYSSELDWQCYTEEPQRLQEGDSNLYLY